MKRRQKTRFVASAVGTIWYPVNWWPHDNLLASNGENPAGPLVIDHAPHITMLLAGPALAWSFLDILKELAAPATGGTPVGPGVADPAYAA